MTGVSCTGCLSLANGVATAFVLSPCTNADQAEPRAVLAHILYPSVIRSKQLIDLLMLALYRKACNPANTRWCILAWCQQRDGAQAAW